ncbi:hypothetical protein [uncultured Dysosmobacter sp.]|uniref:hypothetical protein n=1 Tax=uncultured Dysosmobacter sp. TaxID=2591384 RepID=UPI0026273462|nr:hypothetical protein [uncultured Dysosmobacter sp.]
MSMDLEVKTFRHDPEYFEAGPHPIAKTVKTTSADVKAHAPVQLDESGKIKPVATGEEESVYGIVPEAAASGEEAVVYLTGEFFADTLALEESVTAAKLEAPLRKIGIFLKGVKADP